MPVTDRMKRNKKNAAGLRVDVFNRFNSDGNLNQRYMSRARVRNTNGRLYEVGTIIGYYTGNDGETPNFKVRIKPGVTTDWNESNCEIFELPIHISIESKRG